MIELGIDEKKIQPFLYPSLQEFKKAGIQIIYLGWFWKDWSLINNGVYSSLEGLEIRTDNVKNTGDLAGVTALDEDWVTLNQLIKYYKYGFGRVTDYVNEEIRLNRISRQKGIQLIEEYDSSCSDEYIKSFCNYIGIDVEFFWEQVRKSCNKDLFLIDNQNNIKRKFKVGSNFNV